MSEMSEAEAEVWDEFWDTDAARCCSCPSCNYYAPDYKQHMDEPCLLRTLIERIVAERVTVERSQLAAARSALAAVREARGVA